jgi:glycine reductase complex component B subunit gamma
MAQLAQQVGASRVVVGRRIPHPCGEPSLPGEFDFKIRKEVIEAALSALTTSVSAPTVFRPAHTM